MLLDLFCRAKENGHRIRVVSVLKGDATHFQRNRNAINNTGKQTSGAKTIRASPWFMSEPSISGKGKSNKGAKGSCKGKTLELEQVDTADRSWIHEEWSVDEKNDGWSFDGWNDDGNEHTHVTARSFSLESSEWEKMNLDTRVVADTLPLNCGPEGLGDGRFYWTASGEWIPDGGVWQFQGYDENGFPRSLSGRLTDAHQVLCSAAASASAPASRVAGIAGKKRQNFYVKHNGVYMIPTHSKIGQEMSVQFREIVGWIWKKTSLFQFVLRMILPISTWTGKWRLKKPHSVRDAEQNFKTTSQLSGNESGRAVSLVSPTTTPNRDTVPIGYVIEPVGESLTDVEEEEKIFGTRTSPQLNRTQRIP